MEVDKEKGVTPVADDDDSPIEQVRLTVSNDDDPTLPVWTFRMWFLGLLSCALLSFLNTFFSYRAEPLTITMITVQIATLPVGRFMAKVLPATKFHLPGFGPKEFSLNPGPFNMKEHVLISIFANAGSAFGNGDAYAVGIINIIKAFYKRNISLWVGFILVITTQVLGYGWAGIMRKYVVDPAEMWWPGTLVQVSLFRALHEKEEDRSKFSRSRFFVIALVCSFCWYVFPGYIFTGLTAISVVCLLRPKSITANMVGSGMDGLGIGSFTFDWATVAGYLGSPLVSPLFAIVNTAVGYFVFIYVLIPIAYWGINLYDAKTYPLMSSDLFDAHGHKYDIAAIVNDKFQIDIPAYNRLGRVKLSIVFALAYGLNFATLCASITHVILFHGKDIFQQWRNSRKGEAERKPDIHTRLMKQNYKDIPGWWFHSVLVVSLLVSLALCIFAKDEVQLPWWGLIFAAFLSFLFTLPISIITATTNQTPGLNVITEYLFGLVYPGHPIANVCFKTFSYISMSQANSFLSDFKLGHYLKIPPKSMFIVQLVGTVMAGIINTVVAWYMLVSVDHICQPDLLPPNSPWQCNNDHVFYDASVIWGLVGPLRMFGSRGDYLALNWFFLFGALAPVVVWLLHWKFPSQWWIPLIHMPVLLGATAMLLPASSVNFTSWIVVGLVFNGIVFRYRKGWWERYNYILSAALDAGVAFMGVLLYFALQIENVGISWWGNDGQCPLASCPTAPGVAVAGCPVF